LQTSNLILDFEFDQHLESHKHVISIIMGFRDTGCYNHVVTLALEFILTDTGGWPPAPFPVVDGSGVCGFTEEGAPSVWQTHHRSLRAGPPSDQLSPR
jgi:hypothetical protein